MRTSGLIGSSRLIAEKSNMYHVTRCLFVLVYAIKLKYILVLISPLRSQCVHLFSCTKYVPTVKLYEFNDDVCF